MGHPAHFHLFRYLIPKLTSRGHAVKVLIRRKDILEELCRTSELDYINVLPEKNSNSDISRLKAYLKKYWRISRVIKSFKPTIMLGSEPTLAHLGRLYNIPSVIFSEDDAQIIPRFAKIAYPFVNVIMSPASCSAAKWEYKKVGYNGFHKLAYLHPSVFTPSRDEIPEIKSENYFILRFAELTAYHDKNKKGFNLTLIHKLIEILKPHGDIFISSEKKLEGNLQQYELKINPINIHHALYFAKMYVGDSQSMAVEAALLGTPGLRFNDFSGKISVLNELEEVYQLTHSFNTNQEKEFLIKVHELLNSSDLYKEYKERRKTLLNEKINVPDFFIWFIENYPDSFHQCKKDSNQQYQFK